MSEFYKGASGKLFKYARQNRKTQTDAEDALWQQLRAKRFHGLKFRRQHPIDKYIADFYCHTANLIIEIDGGYHNSSEQKEFDFGRSYEMEELGFQIIRFTNEDVLHDIHKVLKTIESYLPLP